MPQASLYRYTPWSQGISIEWDISVNVEPYFEIAPWWSLAYTAPEIARQRALRRTALQQNVPSTAYEALKTLYYSCGSCLSLDVPQILARW